VKPQDTAPAFPPVQLPELLAPAGSPAAFRAAIAAGADAVYLGGKRFGARHYAGNFDEDGIRTAVAFAHARGVKVYVTVNTLIHDRELAGALKYIIRLYAMGVDAILVQDFGLASLVREVAPGLSLHASTQMTVHNTEGVLAMAAMGFSRVVLARELPLEEIDAIAKASAGTGIGLEIFAHGSLCYSYSGQCLFSSVIGGRSGNRGMCAQPCRKPYTLLAGTRDAFGRPEHLREVPYGGEYIISLKDLCTCRRLDRIVQSPVVSLKIEGRMKSPEYVAIVTSVYRRALDAIARGDEAGREPDSHDLALAFNREFTDGYLFRKRHSAIMGWEQPDNRGLRIGTVEKYQKERGGAVIKLSARVTPVAGDGLFIADPDSPGKGTGFPLNATPQQSGGRIVVSTPGPVRQKSPVFLTKSVALAAKARRIIAGEYPELRHAVPLDCAVTVDTTGGILIEGSVDSGPVPPIRFQYRPDFSLVPARTRPLTGEGLRQNLEKTGGTRFALRSVEILYDGNLFAPVSAINRMRREFLAGAEAALVTAYLPPDRSVTAAMDRIASALPDRTPVPTGRAESGQPVLAVVTDSLPGVNAAAESGCGTVCFEPDVVDPATPCRCRSGDDDTGAQIHAAIRICRSAGIPLVWNLPRISRQPALDSILAALAGVIPCGLSACMTGDPGSVAAVRSRWPHLRVIGAPEMNIFNHAAAKFAASSCQTVVLSHELSGPEIEDLVRRTRAAGCDVRFGMVVQGAVEAMISENCILEPVSRCGSGALAGSDFIGLRDGTGRIFPIRTDRNCRTRVLNADETCLIDYLPEILAAGIGWICIDARGKTPAYIRNIVRIYREALALVSRHPAGNVSADLAALKEQAAGIATGRITSGWFIRGLKEP